LAEAGVIALIIAVLAMLFLPALSRAHESARRSSCQNNLKQLGLVMKMYANESRGGLFPPVSERADNWAPRMSAVYPEYLSDPQVLICPSSPLQTPNTFTLRNNMTHPQARVGEFSPDCVSSLFYVYTGYNLHADSQALALFDASLRLPPGTLTDDIALEVPIREGEAPAPALDPHDPSAFARYQSQVPVMWDRVASDPAESSHKPGGSNVLYLDGHVSFTRFGWYNTAEQFPVTPENAETFGNVTPSLPSDCY
jgi:prepilin-type processing-associated H-X9-DG protein